MGLHRCRIFLALLISLLLLGSCNYTEKTEEITAEITAAQMEGRKAAGYILAPHWKDTASLQNALLDIKSRQSKYLIENKPRSAEAFDSAFISTIRTVNPELAKKIQKQ